MNEKARRLMQAALQMGIKLGPGVIENQAVRRQIVKRIEKQIWKEYEHAVEEGIHPPGAMYDRSMIAMAFLNAFDKAVANHRLAPTVIQRLLETLVQGALVGQGDQGVISRFREQYHVSPPGIMLVSPGKACNLNCIGCYSNAGPGSEKLNWPVFDRIITEAKELWGLRFITISGGEPLAYRSEGHNLLDMARKHHDCYFLMYTNGTLINESMAKELVEIGNVSPAISMEGFQEKTDARRGPGVFQKIMTAMELLQKYSVPFGVSLTATRQNAEELLSEEFVNFIFGEKGALYGWVFQYLPIGRSYTLDMMPTPEQRLWMWKRTWEIMEERPIFLADFWNHGTASYGCLSAGAFKGGGYMVIDWNGAVMPCVFLPYSAVNINKIYAQGGNLTDAWNTPFFNDIRKWQSEYYTGNDRHGNLLSPCLIRDHYPDLKRLLMKHEPDPTDESAGQALMDKDYQIGMEAYGKAYQNLSEPVWKEQYESRVREEKQAPIKP